MKPISHRNGCPAFTLVEMLVSIVVLAMLILMIAQIVGMAGKAIGGTSRKSDKVMQARMVLDRIGVDLAARPGRSDLALSFVKAAGNDAFQFFSLVDGYGGMRQLTEVGYRVQQAQGSRFYSLERGAQGTSWQAATSVFGLAALPALDEDNYDVLSDGVLRLEFCFLKNTGLLSNSALADFSDVTAVVVGVAVLDSTSRKMLTSVQVAKLANALPDTVEGSDPVSAWQAVLVHPLPGIPAQVSGTLYFAERYYELR